MWHLYYYTTILLLLPLLRLLLFSYYYSYAALLLSYPPHEPRDEARENELWIDVGLVLLPDAVDEEVEERPQEDHRHVREGGREPVCSARGCERMREM